MNASKALRVSITCIIVSILGGALAQSSSATVPGQNGKLAFTANGDNRSGVYTVGPDGSSIVQVADHSYDPAFSPDGRSVAYISNARDDQLAVKPARVGGSVRQLTFNTLGTDCCYTGQPAFDPDGGSVVYTEPEVYSHPENDSFRSDLKEVSLDGGEPIKIGNWSGSLSPAISPDGKTIAITAGDVGQAEIHLINRNGSGESVLETGDISATSPSFSPDGARIAFAGAPKGAPALSQIYSMAADGTDLKQLTSPTEGASGPVYSPNGGQIAFTSGTVRVMNVDGTGLRTVMPGFGQSWLGDWQRKAPFVIKRFKSRSRKLKTRLFGPGKLVIYGKRIRKVSRKIGSAGVKAMPIRLKRGLRKRLARRGRVKTSVRVRFAPKGALPNTLRRRITVKRR